MKSTEELIKELTSSHTSVSRDFSPVRRTILSTYLLFAVVGMVLYKIRPFELTIRNTNHGMELISILLFLTTLTYLGFKSFVPGEKKKTSFYLVLLSFLLVMLSLVARAFEPQTYSIIRPFCDIEAMAVSLVTTLVGHLMLKKNEFALSSPLSKSIFLSLPLIAVVFLHGVCSLELKHVFMCHIFAALILPILYLISIKRISKAT